MILEDLQNFGGGVEHPNPPSVRHWLEEIRVSQPEGENGVVSGLILVLVNDSILH